MEVRRDRPYDRPLPALDPTSEPFWRAADRGELVIQRCPACGARQFYPRPLCVACGGTPEWEVASGRGVVYTYTVVRQFGGEPFRSELPYVVAMVELDEGVRMLGNVTDCDPEQVHVGLEVEAWAWAAEGGIAVPFWRPRGPRSG